MREGITPGGRKWWHQVRIGLMPGESRGDKQVSEGDTR